MLGDDDLLGVGAGLLKLALQPFQRPAGILRAVAQAIEELGGKGRVLRMRGVARQDPGPVGIVVGRQHAVGDLVGDLAHLPGAVDAHRDAAEVFDQHETQQRRQRPELADLQRFERLEALDDRLEHGRRDRAVGMLDIAPGDDESARQGGAIGKLERRQLAVETARQVAFDLKDGFFNQIIVVEQPLRRGRDRLTFGLGGIGRAVDFENLLGAVADAGLEFERREPEQFPDFALGERGAQHAQPLFRQEIGAYRRFGDGRETGACLFDLRGVRLNVHRLFRKAGRYAASPPRQWP